MDVFDLVAKIRLDDSEYEQGVGKAKGTFSNLASGVKTGLSTVATIGGAAVAAGAAGVAALTKMGVEGYAQYEQLTGGVETLFKTSQGTVMKYAENAYKTAGMSANQYMETVTSFSASLIQSLDGDTAKAAEVGNMAITDMSDNANKMGTSMEMIQNAYNGFAKQNYTMLDNLKLGYGGTKEEMQRLIDDANKVKEANGEMADLSIDSFADVAEAIHIIQTEMDITGTTSREAATTIEGSISMMKGAWQNLVVGMADENANMEVLIDNFVESVATAAQNLLPRIEQTLIGIGDLITALAPVIAEALPQLVENVLPALLEAAISLVTALVQGIITALPAVYDALLAGVQTILVEVFGVSEEKAGEFANGINSFFTSIKDGFIALVESAQTEGTWLNEVWTGLQNTAQLLGEFLSALWDALSTAFSWCVEQISTDGTYLNTIWENIKIYISGAIEHIQGILTLFTAILRGDWSAAWEAVKDIAQNAWDTICGIFGNIAAWFNEHVVQPINEAVVQPIVGFFVGLWESIVGIWEGIKAWFAGIPIWFNENVVQPIVDFFVGLWESVVSVWDWISGTIESAFLFIVSIIKFAFDLITLPFRFIWENCKEYVFAAFEWIKEKIAAASEWIAEKVAIVWGWIRDNILDPIQEARDKVAEFFAKIKEDISEKITKAKEKVAEIFEGIKENISAASEWVSEKAETVWGWIRDNIIEPIKEAHDKVSEFFTKIKEGVSEKITATKEKVTEIFNAIRDKIKKPIEEAKTSVSEKLDELKKKFTDIFENCKKIVSDAIDNIKSKFDFEWSLPDLKLPHISVSGGEAPYGIGGKGSLPSFSIEWYKKAYDNAMILSSPTIFGYSGGKFLGGGDGNGNEVVAGESYLMGLIAQAVESKNEKIVALLSALLEATVGGNAEMVRALMTDRTFAVGEREFARLVKQYA